MLILKRAKARLLGLGGKNAGEGGAVDRATPPSDKYVVESHDQFRLLTTLPPAEGSFANAASTAAPDEFSQLKAQIQSIYERSEGAEAKSAAPAAAGHSERAVGLSAGGAAGVLVQRYDDKPPPLPPSEMPVGLPDPVGMPPLPQETQQRQLETAAVAELPPVLWPLVGARRSDSPEVAETGSRRSAVRPEFAGELQDLLAKLERRNEQIALSSVRSHEQLLVEVVERVERSVAQPIRQFSEVLAEVRTALGGVSRSLAQADATVVSSREQRANGELLAAEVALLRKTFEAAQERVSDDNRSALLELLQTLDERIEKWTSPHRGVVEALSGIDAKFAHIDTAISSLQVAERVRASDASDDEKLKSVVSVVHAAIDDSAGKVVQKHVSTINALAEEVERRLEAGVASPMQELASLVSGMRDALAARQAMVEQARVPFTDGGGEDAKLVKLATSELRDAIAAMDTAEVANTHRALAEQIRQSVGALGEMVRQVEQNGAVTASHLAQVIEAIPGIVSNEAAAAAQSVQAVAAKLDIIAETAGRRLEEKFAGPVQDLASVATSVREALAMSRTQAEEIRVQLVAGSGEAVGEMRAATGELRDAIAAVAARDQAELENGKRALSELIQQAVVALGEAAHSVERNGEAAASRLTQTIEVAPALLLRETEAAARSVHAAAEKLDAMAERAGRQLAATIAGPAQDFAAVASGVREALAMTQAAAELARAQLAADSGQAASEVRLATGELRDAMAALAARDQVEIENAHRALAEQIQLSVGALGEAAQFVEQNGAAAANRLIQAIEAAPSNLQREAEAFERSVQSAAASATEKLVEGFSAIASEAVSETSASAAALTRISEQLVRQTGHVRDTLGGELTKALADIEAIAGRIAESVAGLGESVSERTRSVAGEVLDGLTAASMDLRLATARSHEATVQTAADIAEAARLARQAVEADLVKLRSQAQSDAALGQDAVVGALRDIAAELTGKLAQYDGRVSASSGNLVQSLQTVLGELRQLSGAIVDHKQQSADAVALLREVGHNLGGVRAGAVDGRPHGQPEDLAADADDKFLRAGIDRFIASRRAAS